MADTAHRRWTLEEFLAWEETQDCRHEFVDGMVRAMAGGSRNADRLAGRVYAFLLGKLAGSPCEPYGSDFKVVAPNGNARYPDVTVDCQPGNPGDLVATLPTVLVEVYSRSTTVVDQNEKLEEYQSIPSVRHIAHLHQDALRGAIWTRDGDVWSRAPLIGPEAIAELSAIGVRMPLAEVYRGVPLAPDETANDE